MKILLLIVILAICSVSLAEKADGLKSPAAWGPHTEGCRFSIALLQESYRYDQPVAVRLTFENVGTVPRKVTRAPTMLVYRIDVLLPDGKPAPLTLEGARQSLATVFGRSVDALQPGEMDVDVIPTLNRLYDMTLLGEYTVTAYRSVLLPERENKIVEVPSNSIKILVHEKEPQNAESGQHP